MKEGDLHRSVLRSLPHSPERCARLAARFYPGYWTRTLESTIGPSEEDLRPWYSIKTHRETEFFQAIAVLPAVARGEIVLEDRHGESRWRTELGRYFYYDGKFMPYLEITVPTIDEWGGPLLAVPFIIPAKVVCKAGGCAQLVNEKFVLSRFPKGYLDLQKIRHSIP